MENNYQEFEITYEVTIRVKIHKNVIEAVDDEWKEMFYALDTPEEIADMVGRNLLDGSRLSQLDGFADQPDSYAVIRGCPEYTVEAITKQKDTN